MERVLFLSALFVYFKGVIPIFQNLWGQGSWLAFLTGRFKKSGIYIPTFVTDNYQEVQKLWVWEIGLLYCLIGHMTNASFKQGVEILLMPKIDKGHKNYVKPEIWEETHLREIFCGTLIFQQSSMSCIDHHVGINWSETTLCLPLVKHLRVTLRCAVNITTTSFQHFPWSLTGLDITACQWAMSKLIAFGELIGQPFILLVILTCHIQSYWKWNKLKFPCCSVISVASHASIFRGACLSSLPANACSTENNIPLPSLANHIVLSKFWKVDLDRRVIR